MDMVFPTCTGAGCFINIAYNQQMPLCTPLVGLTNTVPESGRCREAGNLCVADTQFSFDLTQSDSNSVTMTPLMTATLLTLIQAFQSIPIASLVPSAPYLVLSDSSFRGQLPNPIRIGDYNKDGYPDLLLVTSQSPSAHQGYISLMESSECSKKACSKVTYDATRRSFLKLDDNRAKALNDIKDAKSALWLDIDEDGTLDILVQRVGKGSGASRHFTFIKNNYYHDAFFLKTLCEAILLHTWESLVLTLFL